MNRAVEGSGLYANHFVYLHQLFYSPWGYGLSVPGPNDGMSFALGWSHLLLALVVWIWIARTPQPGDRRLWRFFGIAAVVLTVLSSVLESSSVFAVVSTELPRLIASDSVEL